MSNYPVGNQSRYLRASDYEPTPINPWLIRLPLLALMSGVLIVLILAGLWAALRTQYADRIVPGMSAYGVDLSGMTREQAIVTLEAQFTYDDEAVFTFRDGDRFWQMTAGELGVSFDAAATIDEVFASGHSGNPVADLVDQAGAWVSGRDVAPIVTYDQNVTVERLLAIAEEINRPAQNATLVFDGTDVSTAPSATGRTLDITATLNQLDSAVLNFTTGTELPLVVNETPPIIWEAETTANQIRAALSGPLQLFATDLDGSTLGPWTVSTDQIAALLHVQLVDNGDGTQRYETSIDMNVFGDFLETLAPGLIRVPQNARFHFDEATRELEVIQPSIAGRELDVQGTLALLQDAVFDRNNRTVPMAFHFIQPQYHENLSAAELGITELVSSSRSFYAGSSENRRINIAQSAARFDGVIVAPGEEFSYNKILGDISPEEGFVEGFVIVGGRTVRGVGGGVCQVSTTAFQAAFHAGFPITERWAHGYRVGYYETGEGVGMDAVIFQSDDPAIPSLDMRFINDTPYHLLIETSIIPAEDAVEFRFYSTHDGRQVIKHEPIITGEVPQNPTIYEPNSDLAPGQQLQVDWGVDGADVTVRRTIIDAAGNEREDNFFSHYIPWQNVIQVAPGDPRLG
ncbi:MAG: hypothetical protein D6737_08460 [Chloroflexi bacterium]|nr:MAG: hypothetical protein D6737_08460 [Chloroflexota bacterium]